MNMIGGGPFPRVTVVAGARPNFMKVGPVLAGLEGRARLRFVHTGQHYDPGLSGAFLDELRIPAPDADFNVGSGRHATQTARVMLAFEQELVAHRPDAVVVVGDVNSTLACALTAAKEQVPVAHVEAGLRSFDRTMPEEVNRVLTDRLSTWLLTPSEEADANLRAEGIDADRIHRVGNTMIDTLLANLPRAQEAGAHRRRELRLPTRYGVVTLHRPSNVDDPARLGSLLRLLGEVAEELPLVLPLHPRTRSVVERHGVTVPGGLRTCGPLPYLEFTGLVSGATIVLTDSGGVQEETSALGIACLTLRDSTERPITCSHGTNRLVGSEPVDLVGTVRRTLADPPERHPIPLWDGHAGRRCADVIIEGLRGV
jgi:UDP-N-acetylglucosamine 2-epimerase (non-hydrolysing)